MDLLLLPLYLLYRIGSLVKNSLFHVQLFKSEKAPLPTICAGNITFGGSNKTPLASYLVTFLRTQGYRPALISRGYKGNWEKTGGILSDGENVYGDWRDAGDEPFMMATDLEGLGVFIGKDRLSSCRKAKELGFNIAVLDDAFQHRRLRKDIEIVIWRPEERIALRESSHSLARADILLVEESLAVRNIAARKTPAPAKIFTYSVVNRGLFSVRDNRPVSFSAVKDKRIVALAGIARPERFFSLLHTQGINPLAKRIFSDHSSYPPHAVKKLLRDCGKLRADVIITTQKDSVKIKKIKELEQFNMCYLKIGLDIQEGFGQEILRSLQRKSEVS